MSIESLSGAFAKSPAQLLVYTVKNSQGRGTPRPLFHPTRPCKNNTSPAIFPTSPIFFQDRSYVYLACRIPISPSWHADSRASQRVTCMCRHAIVCKMRCSQTRWHEAACAAPAKMNCGVISECSGLPGDNNCICSRWHAD